MIVLMMTAMWQVRLHSRRCNHPPLIRHLTPPLILSHLSRSLSLRLDQAVRGGFVIQSVGAFVSESVASEIAEALLGFGAICPHQCSAAL